MTVATKRPTRKLSELEPDAVKTDQLPPIDMGMGNTPFTHPDAPVIEVCTPFTKDHQFLLAFNEEPVEIEVMGSGDPHAPLFQEAWVNGKGVERMIEGLGWCEVKFFPVNTPVIIKRKYVEVLLRSKTMGVHTVEDRADGTEPRNVLRRTSANACTVRIIEDRDPPGQAGYRREWAKRLMSLAL